MDGKRFGLFTENCKRGKENGIEGKGKVREGGEKG